MTTAHNIPAADPSMILLAFFYVKRNRETLELIVQREVAENMVIHSNEWPAYSNLNNLNYHHLTVNNQQHHVDPKAGANIQIMERSWLDLKGCILKKETTFQLHLDYFS